MIGRTLDHYRIESKLDEGGMGVVYRARAFVVLEGGSYYIDRPSGEARPQFLTFVTGRSTTVARNLGEVRMGLAASPDGRTILYSRVDPRSTT